MAYKEAELMSQLNHPNIIYLYDCFVTERVLRIVMEYAMGGTLDEFLRKKHGILLTQTVSMPVRQEVFLTCFILFELLNKSPPNQNIHHSDSMTDFLLNNDVMLSLLIQLF
jgi:serine/threonine protein kinase